MKAKRFLALVIAIITLVSVMVLPASAETGTAHGEVEVIIHNQDLSDEAKAKIVAYFTEPHSEDDGAQTYGLTCDLFGHNYEYSDVTTITHKARTTAPRCLKKIYNQGVCSRCDAQTSTLKSSTYIYCCA